MKSEGNSNIISLKVHNVLLLFNLFCLQAMCQEIRPEQVPQFVAFSVHNIERRNFKTSDCLV